MTAYFNSDSLASFTVGEFAVSSLYRYADNYCTTKNTNSKRWSYIPVMSLATVGITLIGTVTCIVSIVESIFKGTVNVFGRPFSNDLSILKGIKQLTLNPLGWLALTIFTPIVLPLGVIWKKTRKNTDGAHPHL